MLNLGPLRRFPFGFIGLSGFVPAKPCYHFKPRRIKPVHPLPFRYTVHFVLTRLPEIPVFKERAQPLSGRVLISVKAGRGNLAFGHKALKLVNGLKRILVALSKAHSSWVFGSGFRFCHSLSISLPCRHNSRRRRHRKIGVSAGAIMERRFNLGTIMCLCPTLLAD